ncbi:MAG: UDP-N-acetylmuramoyl-tripeptide--D-alanyl-D-alanine ligase [Ruminococcus sp.]|nr:UDP-N-acetylmuramoyl-tripeptide--D-alanyl-D-alanine ligase [Ruminococcus sp.]
MNTVLWIIYTAVTLLSVVFLGLREFHMLQLNGYKTPEHSWWIKKNYRRYIVPAALFVIQFLLLPCKGVIGAILVILLGLLNLCIGLANKPGKKFKKPLVYTARVKRMLTTFGILIALFIIFAVITGKQEVISIAQLEDLTVGGTAEVRATEWFRRGLPYILTGSALYLTPLLVPLSNIINKPVEKAVQNWYINDARRILSECPDLHKVGITGSYGKTSMKFYLSELLASQYETLKTPESFNTPMGVTITIRRDLRPTHQYFICEMGARRVHEIAELCGIANPHDGIITSVGPQHLETFGSIENVVNTKFELADCVQKNGGKIYLNGDNDLIRAKAPQYKNAVTYGIKEGNDWRAADISVSDKGTEFTAIAPDGQTCRFTTKLLGEHSVQNLLGAIAYAAGTGIALEKLVLPVKRIAAVPHRLQLLDKGNGVTYIDDAYNSNPSGAKAALDVLGLFDACRILVTPGMVELGAKQEELNKEFGKQAAASCDYIILVGKEQTAPIYSGIQEAGFDMDRVFVADGLNEALAKVQEYRTDKKKIVLLENDLPDNY